MLDAMAHRGPDGRGVWAGGAVALGHLLLAAGPGAMIRDQPIVRGDGCLVGDCRIDNRTEVLAGLRISALVTELSDAELVLRAYERWDERCVERLLGDFAFAIWDAARQRLFCARDHFGVKPLYYWRSRGMFAAASEIKALLTLPEVPQQLDEQMVADHLSGIFADPEITYWREIKRLPPAHTLSLGPGGGAHPRRYWSLDPAREIRLGSDEEYAEALRTVFTQAVDRRIRDDETVGCALSGGLDSTSIACTAARLARDRDRPPIRSFSLLFDSLPDVDERPWIQAALAHETFESHFIAGDRLDPIELLDILLFHQDGIFYAPNLYLHWGMYEQVARSGTRVFLDGLDGDSTLSHGSEYPRELLSRGHFIRAAREVQALGRRRGRSTWQQGRRLSLNTGIRTRVARLSSNRDAQATYASDTVGIVAAEFARRTPVSEDARRPLGVFSRERDAHHRQLVWPVQSASLEAADRAAAAHRIEPRYPFFDVSLVEFCLALPGEQKLRDGWTRWVMRRAMEGVLPPLVQWRADKSNLSPVLMAAINRYGQQQVGDMIARPDAISGYVNVTALRDIWRGFLAHPRPQDVMPIWLALVLDRGVRLTGIPAAPRRVPTDEPVRPRSPL